MRYLFFWTKNAILNVAAIALLPLFMPVIVLTSYLERHPIERNVRNAFITAFAIIFCVTFAYFIFIYHFAFDLRNSVPAFFNENYFKDFKSEWDYLKRQLTKGY